MIRLIAGHNGEGSGAVSPFLDEGIETIILRNLICLNLTRLDFLDFETDDDNDGLQTVLNKLRKRVKKDDILLDLHFNSALKEDVSGAEVFIPSDYTDIEKKLAETLLKTVTETLQIKSRGVKTEGQSQHSRLGMLHIPCHTVLLEVCFLTNKSDVYRYKENRDKLAEKIAEILIERTKLEKYER